MKNNKPQCYEFYVDGMHCAACEILIEKRLSKHNLVNKAKASLGTQKVIVEGNFDNKSDMQKLAAEFTELAQKEGYKVLVEKPQKHKAKWEDFIYAFPIGIGVIIVFLILWKSGIFKAPDQGFSYPLVFLIGIIASLSSCMAVVGGLVLSMASTYAKESRRSKTISQIAFHAARIIGSFFLGGLLGVIGSGFQVTDTVKIFLDFAIAIVMIILAINIMDIFPVFKKLQPTLPKFISGRAMNMGEGNVTKNKFTFVITPILVGLVTFFLPCGFTQVMQLEALKTGNFFGGAMILF